MSAISLVTRGYVCGCAATVVNDVFLPMGPDKAQSLLVRALELPLPPSMTEAKGIHQSDIIIRQALIMAIADLRANPWMLDDVFQSLIEDAATAQKYGEKERQRAIDWFMKTDIPVVMDYSQQPVEPVMVSIALTDSTEAENTLGDVHYQPYEDIEAAWPPMTRSFSPQAYSASTGILKLPQDVADALLVTTGMVLVDKVGKAHAITAVRQRDIIVLTPGTVADFTASVIKGEKPRLVRELESLAFKEQYRVSCHAAGEPYLLTWLHSIITYCLLAYKQVLLEARGFERSTVSSAPFALNNAFSPERVWTRSITVTGYVRQSWAKKPVERILSTQVQPLRLSKVGEQAVTFIPEDGFTEENSPWFAQDGLGLPIK